MAESGERPEEIDGAGNSDGDEEVDPELVALARERSQGSAVQPILYVAVIGLGFWVLADFAPDLKYFFSDRTPEKLGAVHEKYAKEAQEDPHRELDLPHNDYVEIYGIPKRRSESKSYRFFRLVGAPVYVQTPREDKAETLAERAGEGDSGSVDREYFDGSGRLIALWKMPERYQGIRSYYRKRYGTRFCENVPESERDEIRKRQRTAYIESHREEYRKASKEKKKEMSPRPSKEQIREVLAGNPVCIKAYLLLDGKPPGSSWRILALAALFALFILLNIFWLIRWIRNFFSPEIDTSQFESD